MTTVINTPGNNTDNGNNSAGWAVAVIILLVIIGIGGYLWIHHYRTPVATSGPTNINVTIPVPSGTSPTTSSY